MKPPTWSFKRDTYNFFSSNQLHRLDILTIYEVKNYTFSLLKPHLCHNQSLQHQIHEAEENLFYILQYQ